MRRSVLVLVGVSALAVAGCANPNQSRYNYKDVGQSISVEFGTVVAKRDVEITGENTGAGGLLGAGAGAAAGAQFGRGTGNLAATLGGIAAGAIIGVVAEQAISDHGGVEYVVTLSNGKTITIVQNKDEKDRPINPGDRVMVQVSGGYQRVLPANDLPEEIKRPKGIKVVD
jgi:outer membrane lipoprotein SlyB